MLKKNYDFKIPVFVLEQGKLKVIFWSFSRKDYQKTNWWPKTTNTNVSKKLTIRTANTVRKIVRM